MNRRTVLDSFLVMLVAHYFKTITAIEFAEVQRMRWHDIENQPADCSDAIDDLLKLHFKDHTILTAYPIHPRSPDNYCGTLQCHFQDHDVVTGRIPCTRSCLRDRRFHVPRYWSGCHSTKEREDFNSNLRKRGYVVEVENWDSPTSNKAKCCLINNVAVLLLKPPLVFSKNVVDVVLPEQDLHNQDRIAGNSVKALLGEVGKGESPTVNAGWSKSVFHSSGKTHNQGGTALAGNHANEFKEYLPLDSFQNNAYRSAGIIAVFVARDSKTPFMYANIANIRVLIKN